MSHTYIVMAGSEGFGVEMKKRDTQTLMLYVCYVYNTHSSCVWLVVSSVLVCVVCVCVCVRVCMDSCQMAEAVLVNGFENGSGDHQMSLTVSGMSVHYTSSIACTVLKSLWKSVHSFPLMLLELMRMCRI